MKLQFKHQQFQADCAKAVTDVFIGQPYSTPNYIIDKGSNYYVEDYIEEAIGHKNEPIRISDNDILKNLNKVQKDNEIAISDTLKGRYNLTIQMETGTGKTFTYIKTIYELNKLYGWSKFIVIVPSVAVREGVYKSFEITSEYFFQEYEKHINFFIYNSDKLENILDFASSPDIQVMIINSQAFNRDKGLKITSASDKFRSRRPIDVISKTNPILIIDEPQSVEGKVTKAKITEFNPLITLRYSATHKDESLYNMVYRLDALDAYNNHLVKKISVKGIHSSSVVAANGYIKVKEIKVSPNSAPTATIEFDSKTKSGLLTKKTANIKSGYNLHDNSGFLDEYKNGYIVADIRGDYGYVEFLNGLKVYEKQVVGELNESLLRRIQIRETIKSHLQREKFLYSRGIKVLSLFFIDHVANYRLYDDNNTAQKGEYATIFEEEYNKILDEFDIDKDSDYYQYLKSIDVSKTHSGYFSVDKKGKMTDGKISKEGYSDDESAYDLIMKNKERLLSFDEPTRFIFSHSALREGWDNPNVFQICTLKESSSDMRKHQEVGRGLRLCVNNKGERMDKSYLEKDIYTVNILTVITGETYDDYVSSLQREIADLCINRPQKVTFELFIKKDIINQDTAIDIYADLKNNGYIDKDKKLTEKYFEDKKLNQIQLDEEFEEYRQHISDVLESVFTDKSIKITNGMKTVNVKLRKEKLEMNEFKELWQHISPKTAYTVDFSSNELINKSIEYINSNDINITPIYFEVVKGSLGETIQSKESLEKGEAFIKDSSSLKNIHKITDIECNIKYDLIGKIVNETFLTRRTVGTILQKISPNIFDKFKQNPEEFIVKISDRINDIKAQLIIDNITYHKLEDSYKADILSEASNVNVDEARAYKASKHLYDHVIFDSDVEKDFAMEADNDEDVAIYIKLPTKFKISTPVGAYNPDWAIAFDKNKVKHIYFVAETKGTTDESQLRATEKAKIKCAKKHFKVISNDSVIYDVFSNYRQLKDKLLG